MDNKNTDGLVFIKKASGQTEAFDTRKLENSLRKSGASDEIIAEIVADIKAWVYDGVSTKKIYSRAYKHLSRRRSSGSLLYKLRMAINSMGPGGHPFEQFIGELFKLKGYRVEVAQTLQGVAITHEMDVIATKDGEQILMECKFSREQGHSVSIQVPLYVHSRVDDIVEKRQHDPRFHGVKFTAGLVTNVRFTPDSIAYSNNKGIKLLGWDYPPGNALKDWIERERLYPVTILSNLSSSHKSQLMAEGIVTCSQLREHVSKLDSLGLTPVKLRQVRKELEEHLIQP